jgi:hypothetical protein
MKAERTFSEYLVGSAAYRSALLMMPAIPSELIDALVWRR